MVKPLFVSGTHSNIVGSKPLLHIDAPPNWALHLHWGQFQQGKTAAVPDLGISIDLKSADKELKAVMPEKSKTYVTAFTKK